MPAAARGDRRSYLPEGGHHTAWSATVGVGGPRGVGFSHMPGVQERPAATGFGGWLAAGAVDFEGAHVTRELRGVVKEDLRGRMEDSAGRLAERTFQNHWMGREDQQRIVGAQLAAAEALRPGADDYRVAYYPSRY